LTNKSWGFSMKIKIRCSTCYHRLKNPFKNYCPPKEFCEFERTCLEPGACMKNSEYAENKKVLFKYKNWRPEYIPVVLEKELFEI